MKIQTIRWQLSFLLLFTLLLMSCESFNDPESENDGFILKKHLIETELPCYVNIMFQVSDMEGRGITDLVSGDFVVQEDNESVSPTESAMSIKKKDVIPYKLKTVLMLDNSRSVGDNIEEIKGAAVTLINKIVSQQEVAVYTFSEEAILIQDFTSNKADLISAINSISLGYATTDLYGSVSVGCSRWKDSYSTNSIEQGFLVLITDGSDTQGSSSLNHALSDIGGKNVYTIGLGNEQDEDALEQLGTAGYFSLSDYSDLSKSFSKIQDAMSDYANSFYWLYYFSPKRGYNTHTLELRIRNNNNSGNESYLTGKFNSKDFYSVAEGVVINGGINSLSLYEERFDTLRAQTYFGTQSPSYSWTVDNGSILEIISDNSDNSIARINAKSVDGDKVVTVTVADISNSFSTSIVVTIIDGSVVDIDGNSYQSVKIGDQIWMTENLKVTRYNDGTAIPFVENNSTWDSLNYNSRAYCYYNNDISTGNEYGALYTWSTVTNAVCPEGWHVPTDNEWQELETHLGLSSYEADRSGWRGSISGELLEQGTSHWSNNVPSVSNSTGLTILPGGYRSKDGSFYGLNNTSYIWTGSKGWDVCYFRHFEPSKPGIFKGETDLYSIRGMSVRCIKD